MRHDVGEVVTAARLQVDIVDRVGQVGGGGDVVAGELEATNRRFDPPGEQQGVGPVADRGCVAGRIECGKDSLCASAVAEDDPGPTEPVDEAERDQRVVHDAPGQRGVDVGALGPGEGEMLGLVAAAHTLRGGSGRVGEPSCVGGEGALGQSGVGHRFEREGADAVEQPVADGVRGIFVVDDDQRTAGEPADHVDRGGCGYIERCEDGLDRGEGCAASEGGEGPQAPLVVGEQQVVAPSDRRLECSAAFRSAAGRVAQHVEPIVEAAGDLGDRQRLGSCRGELDRQGKTIERSAQVLHRVVGLVRTAIASGAHWLDG